MEGTEKEIFHRFPQRCVDPLSSQNPRSPRSQSFRLTSETEDRIAVCFLLVGQSSCLLFITHNTAIRFTSSPPPRFETSRNGFNQ